MNLCFIYHTFFRYGGIQRVVAQIANALCDEIHIELICTESMHLNTNPYNINLSKIKVHYLPSKKDFQTKTIQILNRKFLHGKGYLLQQHLSERYYSKTTQQQWISFLNKQHYDIIIGCSMTFNTLLGQIKSQLNGQIWGWEHNEYDSYFAINSYEKYQKALYGNLLNKLDGLIVLTLSDAEKYKRAFNLNSVTIPNPLGFNQLSSTNYESKVIISVGRLDPNKQFNVLIKIFESFLINHKDWSLKIIGEGIEKKSLMKQITDRHLENYIEILPYTSEIEEYYKTASIYACTSKYESFGLTVLEAMACGLPILTFNSTGPSNLVIHGVNGYIIQNESEEEFTVHMNKLADSYLMRKNMGSESLKQAFKYQPNKIIKRWQQLLKDIDQAAKREVNNDALT